MDRTVKNFIRRGSILATLAALMIMLHAGSAQAQWVANGNNINNTNAGGVGVGTADPTQGGVVGSKFTVATIDDNTAFATSNGTVPRFALNNHSDGSWTMHDYAGNTWHEGISQLFGNVGIGTRSPNQKFGVQGMFGLYPQAWVMPNVRGMFMYHGGGGGSIYAFNYPAGTGDPIGVSASQIDFSTYIGGTPYPRLSIVNNGDIGIGTNTPSASRLHLYSPANTYLRIGAPLANQSSIAFNDDANGQDIVLYRPEGTRNFSLWTATAGQVLNVIQAGNVGIGTASPVSKLHVAGDITVDGNINAKYQDVAEWVPSRERLSAGTVVVLDTKFANHVLASTSAYDMRVAGVISAQPGLALGVRGENKTLVATTGRVKVKVDATHAPIHIGDLLVTSDVTGVAMRSEPIVIGGRQMHAPGTLIGKALESLEKGRGEILVLLSLQ